MISETVLRLILIVAGTGILLVAVIALAKRKMREGLCLVWGFFSFLFIFSGLLLRPTMWNCYLSYRSLALIVLVGICLIIVAYFISVGISEMLNRAHEMAIQISLLNLENEAGKYNLCEQERKEVLVIIPAFNEAENIGKLLEQIEKEEIEGFADILVIDDGSTDQTQQIVKKRKFLCVSGIFNLGYGSALQTGYKFAFKKGYPYVIQIDADGQHDVCNIKKIYKELKKADAVGREPDIVLGSRFLPASRSFPISGVKVFAIRLFRQLIQLGTGKKIMDPTTGLQGLNARTIYYYSQYGCFDGGYQDANIIMQMLLLGYQIREIAAVMHGREKGKSMHSGLKPVLYMFRMAFSLSAVYVREKLLKKEWMAHDGCVEKNSK